MLQVAVVTGLNGSLIACDDVSLLAVAPETRLNHRELPVKVRLLLQVTHAYVITHGDLATLMRLLTRNDLEQRTLALAVARDEANALALLNGERDVVEEHQVTETL